MNVFYIYFRTIFILTVIVIVGCKDSKREAELSKRISELEIQIEECTNGPERLFTEIQDHFTNESYTEAISAIKTLENNYPYFVLFHQVSLIRNEIIEIEAKRIEEERIEAERVQRQKEAEHKQLLKSLYLKVYAEMYSDGYLSCNILLVDVRGNSYSFPKGKIDFTVYNALNNIIRPRGKSNISGTNTEIFIDIFLSKSNIYSARFVEFKYTTDQGELFVSKRTDIDQPPL